MQVPWVNASKFGKEWQLGTGVQQVNFSGFLFVLYPDLVLGKYKCIKLRHVKGTFVWDLQGGGCKNLGPVWGCFIKTGPQAYRSQCGLVEAPSTAYSGEVSVETPKGEHHKGLDSDKCALALDRKKIATVTFNNDISRISARKVLGTGVPPLQILQS